MSERMGTHPARYSTDTPTDVINSSARVDGCQWAAPPSPRSLNKSGPCLDRGSDSGLTTRSWGRGWGVAEAYSTRTFATFAKGSARRV
jgi:hypothetical protein